MSNTPDRRTPQRREAYANLQASIFRLRYAVVSVHGGVELQHAQLALRHSAEAYKSLTKAIKISMVDGDSTLAQAHRCNAYDSFKAAQASAHKAGVT